MTATASRVFPGALWVSAFRPFFLLGTLYAPLLMGAWLGAWSGWWSGPVGDMPAALWHGHEMVFGFSTAIILGIVLTALPSWAGTDEIHGPRLALIVAAWLTGRLAFWALPLLPAGIAAVADCLLFPLVFATVAPQLLRAANRLYLLLLPVLAAFFTANLAFHLSISAGNPALATLALHGGVYTILTLYVLKGGVLTPIFTGNALREKGRGEQAPFRMWLDVTAVGLVVALAALDLAGAPARWIGLAALACTLVHAWRVGRWQGWRVADVPLLLVMHLGFAWLILAFALKALAALTGLVSDTAWLHAFTVGSLGMMMLGLMTRVSLRHTGRPLKLPTAMRVACALVFAAAIARLTLSMPQVRSLAIAAAALLWAAAFATYLSRFGALLARPSLPRKTGTP
ncbi:NnrS family protein [Aromatoleum petrolei]|uniref:NnrS family protein n=1 Tax=Aromatoleum petrolei TaxID=76116 RepID=A0ABX1MQ58_9RHOO|nr:NnrS family protein [Aromatoleum petrolei]NMF90083.1 NnrS family protein [Aromatoleum petrolei]QTQ34202.1 Nnrs family protein [Aromatoleum petrolei]